MAHLRTWRPRDAVAVAAARTRMMPKHGRRVKRNEVADAAPPCGRCLFSHGTPEKVFRIRDAWYNWVSSGFRNSDAFLLRIRRNCTSSSKFGFPALPHSELSFEDVSEE